MPCQKGEKGEKGGEEKIEIGLWSIPSLSNFKISEFRSYLENIPLDENFGKLECKKIDLKIFTIIRDHIKQALTNYEEIDPGVFEKFEDLNLRNIYRVLFEEKQVLDKNLVFIDGFVEAMETKSFDKLMSIVLFTNEIDHHFFSNCDKKWQRLVLEK